MSRAEQLLDGAMEFALESSCKTCRRRVLWALSAKSSSQKTPVAIAPEPTLRGQYVLFRVDGGPIEVRRATRAELAKGGRSFWELHQCPTYTPSRARRRAA